MSVLEDVTNIETNLKEHESKPALLETGAGEQITIQTNNAQKKTAETEVLKYTDKLYIPKNYNQIEDTVENNDDQPEEVNDSEFYDEKTAVEREPIDCNEEFSAMEAQENLLKRGRFIGRKSVRKPNVDPPIFKKESVSSIISNLKASSGNATQGFDAGQNQMSWMQNGQKFKNPIPPKYASNIKLANGVDMVYESIVNSSEKSEKQLNSNATPWNQYKDYSDLPKSWKVGYDEKSSPNFVPAAENGNAETYEVDSNNNGQWVNDRESDTIYEEQADYVNNEWIGEIDGNSVNIMQLELTEIRRQVKYLQKLPELVKKMQRDIQEITKSTKIIQRNVSKDPEEEPGRVQDVTTAKHSERLVNVPQGTKILILSDSICSRMNGYKISSDLKVCIKSYGGMTISEMITVISTLDEDICYDIDYIFFHVGTNDLGCEDIPGVKSEFKILLKKAMKMFSNGLIFVSAILPRFGSSRELKDRKDLNDLLQILGQKYNRVHFLDTSNEFMESDGTLRGDLYKRDYTHLTLKGMGVLASAFKGVIDSYIEGDNFKKAIIPAPIHSNSEAQMLNADITQIDPSTSQIFYPQQGYENNENICEGVNSSYSKNYSSYSYGVNPRKRTSGRYTQYRR